MASTDLALIVVPRDRYSIYPRCIEALYKNTCQDFHLYLVAGNVDDLTKQYLKDLRSRKENVHLLLEKDLLLPGEARNAGLRRSNERYCVILENDTLVHSNWLPPLIECMSAEKAAVVTPLVWWYRGIHTAGCTIDVYEKNGRNVLRHSILYDDIQRKRIDYPENHCVLIDRHQLTGNEIFDDVEPFDVDLGLQLQELGLEVFFEPRSEVTYASPPSLRVRDLELFKFRWDPSAWQDRNRRFVQKWGVDYDHVAKSASYRRQQLKLGIARWYPTRLTVEIANFMFSGANFLQSQFPGGKRIRKVKMQ